MARSLSSTMLAAQAGTKRAPYIRVVINSVDLSSRLLFIEHIEEPYRDRATLIFRNNDRYFDGISFKGRSFQVGYGFTTGAGDEYCGDGTNSGTPTLWVKSQEIISIEGSVVCQLYCEGMWMYLREQPLIAVPNEGGNAIFPLYQYTFNAAANTYTIYALIEMVIETALGWTLEAAVAGGSDGIIDVVYPKISVNMDVSSYVVTLQSCAEFLQQLLGMTKCYLRQKSATNWELVYPQNADAVNESYYSNPTEGHPFTEYMEKISEITPNRIKVAANFDADATSSDDIWANVITGDSGAYSGNYAEVPEVHLFPWITTQATADLVAAGILSKIQSEALAGRLLIQHDCKVELYDKVRIYDSRI